MSLRISRSAAVLLIYLVSAVDGAGAQVSTPDLKDQIGSAVWQGDVALVEQYLASGGDPNYLSPNQNSFLIHIAAENNRAKVVEVLLRSGADPNRIDRYGNTPLSNAVAHDSSDAVRELIKGKADPNWSRDGYTLLIEAASKASPDTVAALLDGGADINERTFWGATPITAANRWNPRPNIVALLRKRGADEGGALAWQELVNELGRSSSAAALRFLTTHTGRKELFDLMNAAAVAGNALIVEYCLKRGANPGDTDSSGNTALMSAARAGARRIVQILVAAGAPIDHQNRMGDSALMRAAEQGQAGVVELLLRAKADATLKNLRGETARDLAASRIKVLSAADSSDKWRVKQNAHDNRPYAMTLALLGG